MFFPLRFCRLAGSGFDPGCEILFDFVGRFVHYVQGLLRLERPRLRRGRVQVVPSGRHSASISAAISAGSPSSSPSENGGGGHAFWSRIPPRSLWKQGDDSHPPSEGVTLRPTGSPNAREAAVSETTGCGGTSIPNSPASWSQAAGRARTFLARNHLFGSLKDGKRRTRPTAAAPRRTGLRSWRASAVASRAPAGPPNCRQVRPNGQRYSVRSCFSGLFVPSKVES